MNRLVAVLTLYAMALPVAALSQQASNEDLSRREKEARDKASESMRKFYDCVANYVGQNMPPKMSALALADAAVASCDSYVGNYIGNLTASRSAGIAAREPGLRGERLDQRIREVEAEARADGERLKADGRGIGIKYVFQFEDMVEQARRKKDGNVPFAAPAMPQPSI